MSTCTIPTTYSPGHLFLDYSHTTQAQEHRTSVRYQYGTDLADIPARRLEAEDVAVLLQACQTVAFDITGWGIRDASGGVVYAEPFHSPYTGSHPVASGMADARSSTVTITGKGIPFNPGDCSGPTRMVFHVGSAILFSPGKKYMPNGEDSDFDNLAGFFLGHAWLWSDYYGQAAGVNSRYPVQYNARVQKKVGT